MTNGRINWSTKMSTGKYDIQAIRRELIQRLRAGRDNMTLSDEAEGEEDALEESYALRRIEFFEALATKLVELVDARYPRSCEFGNSWDLLDDEMYASGSCDRPPLNTPVHEAYARLRVKRIKALWIFFTRDGVEFCGTNERRGVWFPKQPFKKIGYEDPNIFTEIERILARIGFLIPGLPDRLGFAFRPEKENHGGVRRVARYDLAHIRHRLRRFLVNPYIDHDRSQADDDVHLDDDELETLLKAMDSRLPSQADFLLWELFEELCESRPAAAAADRIRPERGGIEVVCADGEKASIRPCSDPYLLVLRNDARGVTSLVASVDLNAPKAFEGLDRVLATLGLPVEVQRTS